jgi:hypothetical protein
MSALLKKLQKAGIESSHLDTIVDDAVARQGADVNNGGMEDQLRYLEEQGMSHEAIIDSLDID